MTTLSAAFYGGNWNWPSSATHARARLRIYSVDQRRLGEGKRDAIVGINIGRRGIGRWKVECLLFVCIFQNPHVYIYDIRTHAYTRARKHARTHTARKKHTSTCTCTHNTYTRTRTTHVYPHASINTLQKYRKTSGICSNTVGHWTHIAPRLSIQVNRNSANWSPQRIIDKPGSLRNSQIQLNSDFYVNCSSEIGIFGEEHEALYTKLIQYTNDTHTCKA